MIIIVILIIYVLLYFRAYVVSCKIQSLCFTMYYANILITIKHVLSCCYNSELNHNNYDY